MAVNMGDRKGDISLSATRSSVLFSPESDSAGSSPPCFTAENESSASSPSSSSSSSSSLFVPRHVQSQIRALIESVYHSKLEVFVKVFRGFDCRVDDEDEPEGGLERKGSGDGGGGKKSYWDGTANARMAYQTKGFYFTDAAGDQDLATRNLVNNPKGRSGSNADVVREFRSDVNVDEVLRRPERPESGIELEDVVYETPSSASSGRTAFKTPSISEKIPFKTARLNGQAAPASFQLPAQPIPTPEERRNDDGDDAGRTTPAVGGANRDAAERGRRRGQQQRRDPLCRVVATGGSGGGWGSGALGTFRYIDDVDDNGEDDDTKVATSASDCPRCLGIHQHTRNVADLDANTLLRLYVAAIKADLDLPDEMTTATSTEVTTTTTTTNTTTMTPTWSGRDEVFCVVGTAERGGGGDEEEEEEEEEEGGLRRRRVGFAASNLEAAATSNLKRAVRVAESCPPAVFFKKDGGRPMPGTRTTTTMNTATPAMATTTKTTKRAVPRMATEMKMSPSSSLGIEGRSQSVACSINEDDAAMSFDDDIVMLDIKNASSAFSMPLGSPPKRGRGRGRGRGGGGGAGRGRGRGTGVGFNIPRGAGAASVPNRKADISVKPGVFSGSAKSQKALLHRRPDFPIGSPIGSPAAKRSKKTSTSVDRQLLQGSKSTAPRGKGRKSVKNVQFVGAAASTAAARCFSPGYDGGGGEFSGGSASPLSPRRRSSTPDSRRPTPDFQEEMKMIYDNYRFLPAPDSQAPYIYPSRGNHLGVTMPKAYCRGFRYNYLGYNKSTRELRFHCMSMKNGRPADISHRCLAKLQVNLDSWNFSFYNAHICTYADDLDQSKEESMKEIQARLDRDD